MKIRTLENPLSLPVFPGMPWIVGSEYPSFQHPATEAANDLASKYCCATSRGSPRAEVYLAACSRSPQTHCGPGIAKALNMWAMKLVDGPMVAQPPLPVNSSLTSLQLLSSMSSSGPSTFSDMVFVGGPKASDSTPTVQ